MLLDEAEHREADGTREAWAVRRERFSWEASHQG
jgi:hypothetical protein